MARFRAGDLVYFPGILGDYNTVWVIVEIMDARSCRIKTKNSKGEHSFIADMDELELCTTREENKNEPLWIKLEKKIGGKKYGAKICITDEALKNFSAEVLSKDIIKAIKSFQDINILESENEEEDLFVQL